MGRDLILRDDSGKSYSFSTIKTQAWLEGQPVGARKVLDAIRDKAVECFRLGDDKQALAFRALAEELSAIPEQLLESARQHAVDHPYEVAPERSAG